MADGALDLQFRSKAGKNNAQVCSLVVRRVSDGATSATNASFQAATTQTGGAATPEPPAGGFPASLSAYPNSSSDGRATLGLEAQQEQRVSVYVYSQTGQLVSLLTVPARAGHTDFRLPLTLVPGLYYLKTRLDGQDLRFTLKVE